MIHRKSQRLKTRQAGFTLLEMILVLALIVIVYSLATPVLRGPLAHQELQRSVDLIRTEWARARVYAMRTGRTIAFQHLDGKGDYRLQDWTQTDDGTAYETPRLPSQWSEIQHLPDSVVIVSSSVADSRSAFGYADPNAASLREGGWSQPVFFFPDGTTSDAILTLAAGQDQIQIQLRGITGVARALTGSTE